MVWVPKLHALEPSPRAFESLVFLVLEISQYQPVAKMAIKYLKKVSRILGWYCFLIVFLQPLKTVGNEVWRRSS